MARTLFSLVFLVLFLAAQRVTGPRPPKSEVDQSVPLSANLEAATGKGACGPLSAGVVAAFDAAWGACRHEVPCYFR